MQMALVTAGIAGGGVIWRPYLVQERHLGGRIIARTQPEKLAQFVSPEVAAAITNIMTEVTKRGTGTGAALSLSLIHISKRGRRQEAIPDFRAGR